MATSASDPTSAGHEIIAVLADRLEKLPWAIGLYVAGSLAQGQLLTKTAAIEKADAPAWLRDRLRARRRGDPAPLPRLRTAWIAWNDARRTVEALAR